MKDKIKEALETYNKFAKLYADYTEPKLLQFQLNKFISLLKGKKVLDVGCGAGRDIAYFKDEGLDVMGIDISDGLLEEAKKRVKANVKKMDLLNLKFKESEFDGVWCMATLADIPKKEAVKALQGINKILKKDGVFYVAVKEGKGEEFVKKPKYQDSIRFYSYYEQVELENLLKENGFSIVNSVISDDQGTEWVEIFAKKI